MDVGKFMSLLAAHVADEKTERIGRLSSLMTDIAACKTVGDLERFSIEDLADIINSISDIDGYHQNAVNIVSKLQHDFSNVPISRRRVLF